MKLQFVYWLLILDFLILLFSFVKAILVLISILSHLIISRYQYNTKELRLICQKYKYCIKSFWSDEVNGGVPLEPTL